MRKYDAATTLELVNSCRLMAHVILHRYSNLRWYLERLPAAGTVTLEELATRWWPLSSPT